MGDEDNEMMVSFGSMEYNELDRDGYGQEGPEGARQQEKLVDADFFNKFTDVFDEDDMELK